MKIPFYIYFFMYIILITSCQDPNKSIDLWIDRVNNGKPSDLINIKIDGNKAIVSLCDSSSIIHLLDLYKTINGKHESQWGILHLKDSINGTSKVELGAVPKGYKGINQFIGLTEGDYYLEVSSTKGHSYITFNFQNKKIKIKNDKYYKNCGI